MPAAFPAPGHAGAVPEPRRLVPPASALPCAVRLVLLPCAAYAAPFSVDFRPRKRVSAERRPMVRARRWFLAACSLLDGHHLLMLDSQGVGRALNRFKGFQQRTAQPR